MEEFYLPSKGQGRIRCGLWRPEVEPIAIVQIIHGIAEHIERYDHFAGWLSRQGVLVVAEDHMGHGKSWEEGQPKGRFYGGWEAAVADCNQLRCKIQKEHPGVPYFLFGHSMGSFMARNMLYRYPRANLAGAVICGTGWMPEIVLRAGVGLCRLSVRKNGPDDVDDGLRSMIFGGYNAKIPIPRTDFDWLSTDEAQVDAYIADPMCGFAETASLDLDMLSGILQIQKKENLDAMPRNLPVLFIAGSQDPVGGYGEGVVKCLSAFEKTGMEDLSMKLYPKGRHEILNEPWREQVYGDVFSWIVGKI